MAMTRKVKVHCKKCGGDAMLEIGEMSIEEVQEIMKKRMGWHCDIGLHVELGPQSDYWEIIPGTLIEGEKATDEAWLEQIRESGATEFFDTDEVANEFALESFMAPFCFGKRKATGVSTTLQFGHAPSGKRFYWITKES